MADLTISGAPQWYTSSATAKRGFCAVCGSFLFWKSDAEDEMGVALGALDGPTDLHLTRHIFTAQKGDYYDIADAADDGPAPHEEHDNG